MESDPDFVKDVIEIDGEDVRKVEKELVSYNSELWNLFLLLIMCLFGCLLKCVSVANLVY